MAIDISIKKPLCIDCGSVFNFQYGWRCSRRIGRCSSHGACRIAFTGTEIVFKNGGRAKWQLPSNIRYYAINEMPQSVWGLFYGKMDYAATRIGEQV